MIICYPTCTHPTCIHVYKPSTQLGCLPPLTYTSHERDQILKVPPGKRRRIVCLTTPHAMYSHAMQCSQAANPHICAAHVVDFLEHPGRHMHGERAHTRLSQDTQRIHVSTLPCQNSTNGMPLDCSFSFDLGGS